MLGSCHIYVDKSVSWIQDMNYGFSFQNVNCIDNHCDPIQYDVLDYMLARKSKFLVYLLASSRRNLRGILARKYTSP